MKATFGTKVRIKETGLSTIAAAYNREGQEGEVFNFTGKNSVYVKFATVQNKVGIGIFDLDTDLEIVDDKEPQPLFIIPIGSNTELDYVYDRGHRTQEQLIAVKNIVASKKFAHASMSGIFAKEEGGKDIRQAFRFMWHDKDDNMHVMSINPKGKITKYGICVTPAKLKEQAGDNFWMVGRIFFVKDSGKWIHNVVVGKCLFIDQRFPETMELMNKPESLKLYAEELAKVLGQNDMMGITVTI